MKSRKELKERIKILSEELRSKEDFIVKLKETISNQNIRINKQDQVLNSLRENLKFYDQHKNTIVQKPF